MRVRGIALIVTILFAGVLLIMVSALVTTGRANIFTSLSHHNRVAALFVAEAGVAHALQELREDTGWLDGFSDQAISNGRGNYSLTFNTSAATGPVSADESVNNLEGATYVNGPRGEGTVAPGTADLVVVARVGTVERRLEVLLRRGLGPPPDFSPVLSSDRIDLYGDIAVDGMLAYDQVQTVTTNVHSNNGGNDPDVILWHPVSGDRLDVSGSVSVVGDQSHSIDLDDPLGTATVGGRDTEAPVQGFPFSDDVSQSVSDGAGNPPPPSPDVQGNVIIGDSRYSGVGLTVPGDLVLRGGSEFFVRGDLRVEGAIRGSGRLVVEGRIDFRGSAGLESYHQARHVVIESGGDVTIEGYDATAYMEELAQNNSTFNNYLNAATISVRDMQEHLNSGAPFDYYTGNGSGPNKWSRLRRALADDTYGTWAGRPNNCLGRMIEILEAEPPTERRDFAIQKLNWWRDFFKHADGSSGFDVGLSFDQILAEFDNSGFLLGFNDAIKDGDNPDYMPWAINITNQLDWDRLGNSFFEGIIYTTGNIYTKKGVRLLGGVMAEDNGTQGERSIDSITMKPGEVHLGPGTRLRWVAEFSDGGGGNNTGTPYVHAWLGR